MFGRMYPEFLGKIAAAIVFVGFNLTFFPQFVLGYLGMPRRYHAYPESSRCSTCSPRPAPRSSGSATCLPMAYLVWSLKYGPRAEANPWGATGLEWTHVASPPPSANFEAPPVVHGRALRLRRAPRRARPSPGEPHHA